MSTTFARTADSGRTTGAAGVVAVRPCAVHGGGACRAAIGVARRRLRLTRRGRVVLVWLPLTAAVTALLCTTGATIANAGQVGHPATAVVRAGDSLWSIAERVAPQRDPRDEIADIARLNALRDSTVVPGERLLLP